MPQPRNRSGYFLIAVCSLGKTVQALALAEVLDADKIIVVTKKSKAEETVATPGSWQQWSTKLANAFQILPRAHGESSIDSNSRQILITNYESIHSRNDKSSVLSVYIRAVVKSCIKKKVVLFLDESHCIKDPSANQSKALKQLKLELTVRASELHAYLLTGTPFTRGFVDVWNQLRFLGCPMPKMEFRDRFCILGNIPGLLGWQQPIKGYKNVDLLYDLIHQYAITLKSEDVVKLPPQSFVEIVSPKGQYLDCLLKERTTADEIKAFAKVLKKSVPKDLYPISKNRFLNPFFRNSSYPEEKWLADTPATLWLRGRQMSIGFQGNAEDYEWFDETRLTQLRRLLTENEDNYVLFYNYTPEFFAIFELLEGLGYNVDVYNGEIKSLYFYEKFSNQSEAERLVNKKNVILSNFASGSTGMNWQLYNKCIVFSLPVYRDWAQGLKRVHRTGSTNPVTYYIFSQDNWLDRGMRQALTENRDYSEAMFEEGLRTVYQA